MEGPKLSDLNNTSRCHNPMDQIAKQGDRNAAVRSSSFASSMSATRERYRPTRSRHRIVPLTGQRFVDESLRNRVQEIDAQPISDLVNFSPMVRPSVVSKTRPELKLIHLSQGDTNGRRKERTHHAVGATHG
jgi:hypothetical protein